MTTHTKGPWMVSSNMVFRERPTGFAGDFICECYGPDERARDEDRANAQLIAAAPDLLEALADLVEKFGCGTAIELDCELCSAARKAIEKANGRR